MVFGVWSFYCEKEKLFFIFFIVFLTKSLEILLPKSVTRSSWVYVKCQEKTWKIFLRFRKKNLEKINLFGFGFQMNLKKSWIFRYKIKWQVTGECWRPKMHRNLTTFFWQTSTTDRWFLFQNFNLKI